MKIGSFSNLMLSAQAWEIVLVVLFGVVAILLGSFLFFILSPNKRILGKTTKISDSETIVDGIPEISIDNTLVEEVDDDSEDSEKEIVSEGKEIIVRYYKSFLSKLIQADQTVKNYYKELTNYLLDYELMIDRISWRYSSFNVKRKKFAKLNIKGKTLCFYCALDPSQLDMKKYLATDVSSIKKYEKVPCMLKITSQRALARAKSLISKLANEFNLTKFADGPRQHLKDEDYVNDTTENLIARGLIKVKAVNGEEITHDAQLVQERFGRFEKVSVKQAHSLISDEEVIKLVHEEHHVRRQGKRAIINIDTLSKCFEDNDFINLEILKARGLVGKKESAIKILARGTLNKVLTVEADDFSLDAIKMIVLTGGTVLKY